MTYDNSALRFTPLASMLAGVVRVSAALCCFLAACAFSQATGGQTASATPTLQAADIHASSNLLYPRMQGGVVRSGRYELRQATMLDLIATAYGVDADIVFG